MLCKVFERVVLDQTEEFLSLNKILYDYKSGFRKNHSTDTCLSFLNDKILKGFDDGLETGMILINHDILLKKLIIIGFSDHTVKWFQSYLSNGRFTVDLENSFSEVSKRKIKKLQKLETIYNNIRIKQHSRVTYLGCIVEETMSGHNKVISKVYVRLKFLHRKNQYLTPNLCRHLI